MRIVMQQLKADDVGMEEDGTIYFKSSDGRIFNILHYRNHFDACHIEIHEVVLNKEVKSFLEEINRVCIKHNMSIIHEDDQGAFMITEYDDRYMDWLNSARWEESVEEESSETLDKKRSMAIDKIIEMVKELKNA